MNRSLKTFSKHSRALHGYFRTASGYEELDPGSREIQEPRVYVKLTSQLAVPFVRIPDYENVMRLDNDDRKLTRKISHSPDSKCSLSIFGISHSRSCQCKNDNIYYLNINFYAC